MVVLGIKMVVISGVAAKSARASSCFACSLFSDFLLGRDKTSNPG